MGFFNRLVGALLSAPEAPKGRQGARAYAVGDIHGRLDLLNETLERIEADISANPAQRIFLIFLGDLIDRGPDSAGVVERLRNYTHPQARIVFIAGNHEEFFLRALNGEEEVLQNWLYHGGAECVASYGIAPADLASRSEKAALKLLRDAVPPEHRKFLESFCDTFLFGDYLFVHAGIRPGVALDDQSVRDLRWIREPFLEDRHHHGFVVVHGHTIVDSVEERPNRIAIDTGAYKSGILTTLVIEEGERRYIATGEEPATVASEQ